MAKMAGFFHSLRGRLVGSFLAVSLVPVVISLWVGRHLLYEAFVNEGRNRVRLDLNAAREMLGHRIDRVEMGLLGGSQGETFRAALRTGDPGRAPVLLRRIARGAGLDFAGLVTPDGRTVLRLAIERPSGGPTSPTALLALRRGSKVSGVAVWSEAELRAEDPALAERARIRRQGGGEGRPGGQSGAGVSEETSGLVIAAAVPILDGEVLRGVLYGGILLNRRHELVDHIRDTLFRGERHRGREIGTATLFFRGLRIATNVLAEDGSRAIGTRVSAEVERKVLGRGERWSDRAFVVNAWYLTAYEPLVDVLGQRVGMLYVGVLEEKYSEVRNRALALLAALSMAGGLLAFALGALVERRLMDPVHRLVSASREVARGNLAPYLGRTSSGDMGELQRTFGEMLQAIRLRAEAERDESESRLARTEKQASVGRLAAGVAHEINNPLTGVLTYTHLLLRRKDLAQDVRADLETIVGATERVRQIVKGLLDFSRQTALDREAVDLHRLVKSAVALVENQALVKGVELRLELAEPSVTVTLDRNQMESVLLNLLLNALDATRPGDRITVTAGRRGAPEPEHLEGVVISSSDTGHGVKPEHPEGVVISISDTGHGIKPEHLGRIFEPFFTTKDVGQGTGLGLAVTNGIVRRHGGTITVDSVEGEGSTFTLWLPHGEETGDETPGG